MKILSNRRPTIPVTYFEAFHMLSAAGAKELFPTAPHRGFMTFTLTLVFSFTFTGAPAFR
jgi:hypothetical protein